jgi:hypothetical protein
LHRQLFRQEALDFQRNYRQWGDVAALEPLSIKITASVDALRSYEPPSRTARSSGNLVRRLIYGLPDPVFG